MPEVTPEAAASARIAAWLGAIICLVSMGLIWAIVGTHHPENHIALDVRICYVLCGLTFLVAVLGRWANALSPALLWIAVGSAILLAATIIVVDQWNMVVGYELWLSRGQPAFGEPS